MLKTILPQSIVRSGGFAGLQSLVAALLGKLRASGVGGLAAAAPEILSRHIFQRLQVMLHIMMG